MPKCLLRNFVMMMTRIRYDNAVGKYLMYMGSKVRSRPAEYSRNVIIDAYLVSSSHSSVTYGCEASSVSRYYKVNVFP